MSGRVFLDTNLLVYAIETASTEPEKPAIARSLTKRGDVCISTQVLGEFYRAVTNPRRASPLTHDEAVAWVQFWKRYEVRPITVPHVDLALEIAKRFNLGYYDSLILAAARLGGCSVVYSEDLNPGQDYGGVRVENPFDESAESG